MHIREKIAHVLDTRHIKHNTVAKALNISRQAFSKRLNKGNFTDEEVNVIATILNMSPEALKNVDPKRTELALTGGLENGSGTIIVVVTINKMEPELTDRLISVIKQLSELQVK